MVKTLVTIKHTDINSGSAVAVICNSITVAYTKTNSSNPNANYDEDTPLVRVQNQSVANPFYAVKGVKFEPSVTTIKSQGVSYTVLTEELMKDFMMIPNLDTDPILLKVVYGDGVTLKSLHKYSGSRVDDIPVTFNGGVNLEISTKVSNNASQPSGSFTLIETKKI